MKNIKKIILPLLIFVMLFCFKTTFAASLYLSSESKEVKVGDTFVVDIKLSSADEKINVLESTLSFNKDILKVAGISTGDSIFTLWTRQPIFSNESGKIMFTGGVPNGFSGKDAQVVRIIFSSKAKGDTALTFLDDSSIYLNDGKGTKAKLESSSLSIKVLNNSGKEVAKDEWQDILTKDKIVPEKIKVQLGRDASMFDNKYFISFFTKDEGTGIKSYEVKEGDTDFIQSESPYVLKDQSLKSSIVIRVSDKAGNIRTVNFNPSSANRSIFLSWWFILIYIIIILVVVYFKFKKKNAK